MTPGDEDEEALYRRACDLDQALYVRACEYVVQHGEARITVLQRRFRVGYNHAARWVDRMRANGVIPMPRDRLH